MSISDENTNISIKSYIDPSTFSDPLDALALYPNKVRQSFSYDAFGGKTTFRARVLSRPVPMTADDLATYRQASPERLGTPNAAEKRGYLFQARIIDDPSPHSYIPNPCDETLATNEIYSLIAMHTKFVMMIPDMGDIPFVGDTVMVKLQKNVFSYNLQIGEALRKIDAPGMPAAVTAGCTPIECTSLGPGSARAGTTGHSIGEAYESTPPYVAGDPTEPPAISAMRNLGYQILEDGKINIVGIREVNNVPDQFNDRMQLIWFTNSNWFVKNYTVTTVPGVEYLRYPMNGRDAAVMFPGQYTDAYVWGVHRDNYSTLRERGEVKIWRDFNKNDIAGDSGDTKIKNHGLNLHAAANAKTDAWAHRHGPPPPAINVLASGNTYGSKGARKVHSWSAGCQVFKYYKEWSEAMSYWNDGTINRGQKKYTYTLIMSTDLPNSAGIADLDTDANSRASGTVVVAPVETPPTYTEAQEGTAWEYVNPDDPDDWSWRDISTGKVYDST